MMISLFAHISAEIKIQEKKNWKRKAQLCQYHRSQLFICLSFHRFIDIHWYSSVVSLNSLKWQYVLSSRLLVPMQSNWIPIRWDQVLKLLPSSQACVRIDPYQSPTQLIQIERLRELKIKKSDKDSQQFTRIRVLFESYLELLPQNIKLLDMLLGMQYREVEHQPQLNVINKKIG